MHYELFGYLKEFVRNNIKKYYAEVSENELYKIVCDIASQDKFKQLKETDFRSGVAYKIMDVLLEEHVEKKMGNTLSYSGLCKYINALLSKRYSYFDALFTEEEKDEYLKKAVLNVIGATDRDYGKYIDGKYDEKFVLEMERFVSLAYDECALQVSASLRKSDVKYSNNRVLIHRTVDKLLQKYPRDEIRFGMSDSVIYNVYKESVEQLIKEVKNYVRKFLDNKMVVLGVQYDKVTEYVLKKVIVDGDIDPDDLFKKKYDADIDRYADSINTYNVDANAKSYISDKIRATAGSSVSDETVFYIRDEIFAIMKENNVNLIDVTKGVHDSSLLKLIQRKLFVLGSVNKKDENVKVKRKPKKRKFNAKLWAIIIAAILTVLGLVKGVDNFKSEYNYFQSVQDEKNENGFGHYYVFSDDNDFVSVDAENSVEFYNKLIGTDLDKKNTNYKYLGFYMAYDMVGQDRLHIMDRELRYARMCAPEDSEISKQLEGKTCFLAFAMDRLYEMGFEEIRDDKYVAALSLYERAMRNPDVDKAMDDGVISDEYRDIIEDIMEKYREYSRATFEKYTMDKQNGATFVELAGSVETQGGSGRKS